MNDHLNEQQARYGINERIKKFVLEIYDFCDKLPSTASGNNIRNQLSRSASSIGANYRAAWRGRSDKEYIAKLGISEEESDESCYWLDLVRSREKWSKFHSEANTLYKEADQITAIIVSLIKRKKESMNRK